MAIVGRESPADIILGKPEVSARHAEARILPDGSCELVDLRSTNGTFVNDRQVERCIVREQDRVRFATAEVAGSALIAAVRQVQGYASSGTVPTQVKAPPVGVSKEHLLRSSPEVPSLARSVFPEAEISSPAATERKPRRAQPAPPAEAEVLPPTARAEKPEAPPARREVAREAGLGTEVAVALAMQKSFTGKAFLTWFLYWLLWFPGMIMNLVFLSEARRVTRLTGESPPGTGCLWLLIWTHLILPLLLVFVGVTMGLAVISSFFNAIFR